MTNEKQKNLEERTKNDLKEIGAIINYANEFAERGEGIEAIHYQTLAIYRQNEIIIDYLKEIYKTQTGEKK